MIRIWHPMRDPHHCCFRMLALITASPRRLSVSRASLLDTFLLFPEYLHEIQYTGFGELRGSLQRLNLPKMKDSFTNLPDIRIVYRELQVFQRAALHQLVAKNILSSPSFKDSRLQMSEVGMPSDLKQTIQAFVAENSAQLAFIANDLNAIPLDGPMGLFRRTNLEMGGRLR
ncbi:ABC-three component system middle component 5 [Cochlodiniinecator piscidefendens]|uniref:ABC-three component system middle component 5 n=1 Tax=Cochlodiniinecator piscidefendens TaxID=2715756 RepID=UPI0038B38971